MSRVESRDAGLVDAEPCGRFTCYRLRPDALRRVADSLSTLADAAGAQPFELAIGVTSGQALAGVVGPLIEVPVLVGPVYVSLWLRRRWTARESTRGR